MKKVLFIIASLIAASAMCAAGCSSDKTKTERDEKPYGLIEELPQETEKPQRSAGFSQNAAPRQRTKTHTAKTVTCKTALQSAVLFL